MNHKFSRLTNSNQQSTLNVSRENAPSMVVSSNLFKFLFALCLTLSIISVISLNIIRTYSINNTRTNALGNTTSGIATQSASDGNALTSPPFISLKLSPVTTNTTSNPDNVSAIVSLNIPADGGVAVGGHSVEVTTNSTAGYKVTMSLDNGHDSTDLVNTDLPSQTIPSLPEPTSDTLTPLEDKTWGIAILVDPLSSAFSSNEVYSSTDQTVLSSQAKFVSPGILRMIDNIGLSKQPTGPNHDGTAADNLGNIYYGVRVDDPSTFTAGQYTTSITYTAIANIPPAPELTKLILNDSVQQNQTSEFAIEGTNLDTVYDVWIDYNDNGKEDANEKATNVTTYPNTNKASTIISFTNPNPTSNTVSPGAYDVYVVGQGGTSQPLTDAFIVQEESICRNGDPNSDCQVDIDDNMIPIYYAGNNTDGSAIWKVANVNNPGEWYDYTKKQWANAVTVQSGKLTTYKNKPGTTINNNDVLGYWVYIPRYAYEVQRPNAIDRVVTDEYPLPDNVYSPNPIDRNSHAIKNEFTIHFEAVDKDTVKTAPATTCNSLTQNASTMWQGGVKDGNATMQSSNLLAKDYRTSCGLNRIYQTSNQTGTTTWATHPAFIYGSNQLNGFWIAKFEMTGTATQATVKPNQRANQNELIGALWTLSSSIGAGTYNPSANGGNEIRGISQNSHKLSLYRSRMIKNVEWGATAYLSSSKYGAGVNNVSMNTALPNGGADRDGYVSRYGTTGCGPYSADRNPTVYTDGTQLNQANYESLTACSSNKERAYNGTIGVLASTTNNIYGVYDMAGQDADFVAGNATNSSTSAGFTPSFALTYPIVEPNINLYKTADGFGAGAPAWSVSSSQSLYNHDVCTWETCGGQALHETRRTQSPSSASCGWGSDWCDFANFQDSSNYLPWFSRGGYATNLQDGGIFTEAMDRGTGGDNHATRPILYKP